MNSKAAKRSTKRSLSWAEQNSVYDKYDIEIYERKRRLPVAAQKRPEAEKIKKNYEKKHKNAIVKLIKRS